MYKKIVLITICTVALTQASNNTAAADNSKLVLQKQKSSMPLDFTPLPRDIQNLVLGYVGSGWQKADTTQCAASGIYDLYYFKDALLVAVAADRLKPVIFGQIVGDNEFVSNLEIALTACLNWQSTPDINVISPGRINRERGCYTVYGKNYRACHSFGYVSLRKTKDNAPDPLVEGIHAQYQGEEHQATTSMANFMATMVYKICFSPDDMHIAIAKGRTLYLYTVLAGKLVKHFPVGQHLSGLAISPDNKYIAAGIAENGILLIDVATGTQTIIYKENLPEQENKPCTRAVTFSPDGKYLMAGTDNGQVHKFEFQPDLSK